MKHRIGPHTVMPERGCWYECDEHGSSVSYYLREDAEQAALQHESQEHR